jgi:hypothetical protein
MVTPQPLGVAPLFEREVLLIALAALGDPFAWSNLSSRRFTCFCALDIEAVPSTALSKFCSRLIELGCAYFCAWGPGCERVHDAMDEQAMGDDPPKTDVGCVMTTWHADESLEEALWFFLNCTVPDEDYAPNGCDTAVIFSVGRSDWSAAIESRVRAMLVAGEG